MSIEVTREQLSRLFNASQGLTGKELAAMFGTEEFVLMLLDDAKHLNWLSRVHGADLKPVKPARYWCSKDSQTMSRICDIAEHYGISGMDDLLMEAGADAITRSGL